MDLSKREAIKKATIIGMMLSAGLITRAQAEEWNQLAFAAKTMEDVFKNLGSGLPEKSDQIKLNASDIAENGAVVPISIETDLKAQKIAILVEKNPSTLAAQFDVSNSLPFVTTRVKLGQTSNVHAVVQAEGKWFMATKEIKVTLGGCGG
jgi:sulfur-oxidizing protein SoxY